MHWLVRVSHQCRLYAWLQALQNSIKWLGKYAGKAAQNASLARSTLNYHVVPGQALTAEQLGAQGGVARALTRANETVYFWQKGWVHHRCLCAC